MLIIYCAAVPGSVYCVQSIDRYKVTPALILVWVDRGYNAVLSVQDSSVKKKVWSHSSTAVIDVGVYAATLA